MKRLKKGDRIRLKVRLLSGWKGTATLVEDESPDGTVQFVKDGDDPNDWLDCLCFAGRHEVAKMRTKGIAA